MRRKPTMSPPTLDFGAKRLYIERHLFYELKWLLDAATEWHVQDQLKLGIPGYNIQVYAMDSVFLHSRALFEFFVASTSRNHYSVEQFIGTRLQSVSYDTHWVTPLHSFAMHARDRSHAAPLNSYGTMKDLKEMPIDFAREIIRLWTEFEVKLATSGSDGPQLQLIARDKRATAIDEAKYVVNSDVAKAQAEKKGMVLAPVFT